MARVNLIFYKTPYDDGIVDDITQKHLSVTDYHFTIEHEPKNVLRRLNLIDNGIFLFYINNKEDLQEAMVIFKAIQKFSHHRFFRFFCVLTFDYNRSESLLKKLGCLGFFTPKENPLKVAKKIDALRKKMRPALEQFRNEFQKIEFEIGTAKNDRPKVKVSDDEKTIEPIRWVDPLATNSDIWIIKSEKLCHYDHPIWKLQISGPSAHLGKWTEVTTVADNINTWRFTFLDANDLCLTSEEGFWFFTGERPIYDWHQSCWIFKSTNPHLYFTNNLEEVYSRIYCEHNVLYLAKNSEAAQLKESLIEASTQTKFNAYKFNQLREEYLATIWVREFSLESGEVTVKLEDENNNDLNLPCEFEDIHGKELIIFAPHKSILPATRVRANVSLNYAQKTAELDCLGFIDEIEQISETKDSLVIAIEELKEESLKNFLDLYQLRQQNINDFMSRARGF